MAKIADKELLDATEVIDGNQYERCKFIRCKIVYRGGELPSLASCNFSDCTWTFEEAADFQLPISFAKVKPRWMSVSRFMPRHRTMFPGGASRFRFR